MRLSASLPYLQLDPFTPDPSLDLSRPRLSSWFAIDQLRQPSNLQNDAQAYRSIDEKWFIIFGPLPLAGRLKHDIGMSFVCLSVCNRCIVAERYVVRGRRCYRSIGQLRVPIGAKFLPVAITQVRRIYRHHSVHRTELWEIAWTNLPWRYGRLTLATAGLLYLLFFSRLVADAAGPQTSDGDTRSGALRVHTGWSWRKQTRC